MWEAEIKRTAVPRQPRPKSLGDLVSMGKKPSMVVRACHPRNEKCKIGL
jgi:hypothetical protein